MATYGDLPLQEWLRSIDGVKWEINGRVPRYFVEKIARRANSPLECPKESKRRMAESVASDWSNVESPNKDDWSYENSPNKNGGNVESPSEDWSDVVSLNKNWSNAKTPNKICVNVESPKENWRSEKPVQCEEICEDKMVSMSIATFSYQLSILPSILVGAESLPKCVARRPKFP